MLGVVRADLPALMAIEHHSQAKFLVRRADSSELEDFVLRYKVDGGRAHCLSLLSGAKISQLSLYEEKPYINKHR